MEAAEVVSVWIEVLALTERMLDCARKSDWDDLVRLEQERARLIEVARQEESDPVKARQHRDRKRELIQAIMTRDDEIRLLTQDWMRELREILASVNTEQRLNKTYSQP
ncbi:MAG: flagellar protein FliT [Burkholderiales bacterium]|nr:flagellar protein FliT [Burkholderiales bacterium]